MKLDAAIRRLPKTDLHCHLDGSMRAETILEIAKGEKIDLGVSDLLHLREILHIGRPVRSLPEFLRAFDVTCSVLQTREAIERIAFELAEDASAENVRYLEVRFSPLLCTKRGLTHEEVLRAARRGLSRAEAKYPIRTGLIVCALRNLDPRTSVEMSRVAVALRHENVVGFDLAQAERNHPARLHAEAFRIAREKGLGLTVHAGEEAGPESIRQALDDCGAHRIGHGRTLGEDPELERRVAQERIPVECCPSSNVQIGLVPSFGEHPLKGYVERGVRVTLNTDNRLLTGVGVTDEYLRCASELGFGWSELTAIALNGFRAAFLEKNAREALIQEMEREIGTIPVPSLQRKSER